MKNLLKLSAVLILGTCGAFAQLTTTSTTTSAAIAAGANPYQVCVASATNINATSISATGTYLMIDKEAFQVTGTGTSATCFKAKGGQLGTARAGHASGALVWVGNAATGSGDSSRPFTGVFTPLAPVGTCVATSQYSLPVIVTGVNPNHQDAGVAWYCLGGVWSAGMSQTSGAQPFTAFSTLDMPSAIATTTFTDVSGKLWYSQLFAGTTMTSTGACDLNGTVGTDKVIYALWDSAGNLLATTALAGTNTATNSKYQCIAWVTPVNITGPGTYYIGLQGNGTADTFQAYATGGAPPNYATGVQTGGAFGTILPLATPSTTFTTAIGPLMIVY
jgi:hypothetical protein